MITIDHAVLPAHDYEASARFFAQVMGLTYEGPDRYFAPVKISDTFRLVYMNAEQVLPIHIGFHVSHEAFEAAHRNILEMGLPFGSNPREVTNRRTDHPFGGKGLFFVDPNGHLFEIMTVRDPR